MLEKTTNNITTYKFKKLTALTSPKNNKISEWIETAVVVILPPSIGFFIDPLDPFFIDYQFPWLILAPLLISLRYGFVHGITAALFLTIIIWAGYYLNWPQNFDFPQEMVIGLIIITMISAEFHELWNRKVRLFEKKFAHNQVRMNKFARTYHLIKGSHYQLEQHLASQAKSLRLTLIDLNKKIFSLEKITGEPLAGIGESILKIFGAYTNVHVAGIYAVNERREIIAEALAYIGKPCTLLFPDPLVEKAMRTGHTASIDLENLDSSENVRTIVAIPLIDVYQRIWGIVVVNEMPLFALQNSTMDLFTILGGRIGDLIQRRIDFDLSNNDDRKNFERKLRRILEEASYLDASAMVIAISISSEELRRKLHSKLQAELRGIDEFWVLTDNSDRQVLLILLQYTDENGAIELLNRTEFCEFSTAKVINHRADRKILSFLDGHISACLWLLNNKTSRAKLLLETYQFCKNGSVDGEIMEYKNASITDTI